MKRREFLTLMGSAALVEQGVAQTAQSKRDIVPPLRGHDPTGMSHGNQHHCRLGLGRGAVPCGA
jgi:hypothetical protein